METSTPIHVALAGNPNSGKTSVFNALTGARQHVGNYPGVTVERRTGQYSFEETRFDVSDLPGTYSLSSHSPEERIAQDELLSGRFDVVVVVVDSTALKRSLVLMAQILQTGANPVLCLNMWDEAERAGQRIDIDQLISLLGFPVVSTVGHKGIGTRSLKRAVQRAASSPYPESRLVLGERMTAAVRTVAAELKTIDLDDRQVDWIATKLLIDDSHFVPLVQKKGDRGMAAVHTAETQRKRIELDTGVDISLFAMQRYYGFVDGLLREVIIQKPRGDARALSDAVDSVLANRFLGIPIFFGVMYGIFWLTFDLGEIPMGWIETGFDRLGKAISGLFAEGTGSPVQSLLVDGIIGGVGGVVVFLPNILLLFLGLALLEDTGYIARAAFLVDRVIHRFGLHGRSFIPLVTGFGCTIPGIMATRTMENERDRLTTMLVLPLMSCGARLPIWMLLIPAFFPEPWRAPALFGIYMVGIALALSLALLQRKTVLKGDEAPFVMELPPYRLPTLRALMTRMLERAWLYLRKAGTIILGVSLLMWVMTSYPKRELVQTDDGAAERLESADEAETANQGAAEALEYAIAGRVGRFIEPLLEPLGFDWKIGVALIGAFAAKEVFVAQMGVIYAMGEADEESEGLRRAISRDYPPLMGVSLILFLLIASPCMATIAVTRRESGSWKWAALQLGGLTAVGYLISLACYQIGRLFI
jgi:ferrous iron transport protein B